MVLKLPKPRVIDVDATLIDKVIREEKDEWEKRLERILNGIHS